MYTIPESIKQLLIEDVKHHWKDGAKILTTLLGNHEKYLRDKEEQNIALSEFEQTTIPVILSSVVKLLKPLSDLVGSTNNHSNIK